MAQSKSSKQWLKRHFSDAYVRQRDKAGYRSRAAFKLIEIDQKFGVLDKARTVVDLGAAPGGWSQVAVELIQASGRVIALDKHEITPIDGVTCLKGDFTSDEVYESLLDNISSDIDVVLSDMAPELSGNRTVDQAKSIGLLELAFDFAQKVLLKNGHFVAKAFNGAGLEEYILLLKANFQQVKLFKPKSSRQDSREIYIIARNYKQVNCD